MDDESNIDEWEDEGGDRAYYEYDDEIDYDELNEEAKAQYDIDDYG